MKPITSLFVVLSTLAMSALSAPTSLVTVGRRDGSSEFDADLAVHKVKRDGSSEFDADLAVHKVKRDGSSEFDADLAVH